MDAIIKANKKPDVYNSEIIMHQADRCGAERETVLTGASGMPPDNPFRSQAQRRFMYARHPQIAKKFSAHTPKGAKLPERVKK